MSISILIPAYQPEEALLFLIDELRCHIDDPIIIVNDGSKEGNRAILESVDRKNCYVISHAVNLGKGAALKSGINYALCHFPDSVGIVTADADGQHLVKDILLVRSSLIENQEKLILGSRCWKGKIPLRSKIGNITTKYVFWFLTGLFLEDIPLRFEFSGYACII